MKMISVKDLAELQAQGSIEVIDVRTPVEFRGVHIEFARNVPLNRLDPQQLMKQRNGSADQPLYLLCKSGNRASIALKKFTDAGFSNIVNVEGGTDAWVAAGLPVVRGKQTISLERQGRIVAGGLAAAGAIAALATGQVAWAIIPAFVGSGLVFAGVTDSCLLGLLLAKMPWNNLGVSDTCCLAK